MNRSRLLNAAVTLAVILMLTGLPLAVWLDLRHLTEVTLLRQARDIGAAITSIRDFYASDVVGRVLAHPGTTRVLHTYQDTPGAIPLPATLSLELGRLIRRNGEGDIDYRFVSDHPFASRAPHTLDAFESGALARLRQSPDAGPVVDSSYSGFTGKVRMITPVIMGAACVACHNTHPDSAKRDWKIGDVRAIQEIIVALPLATNLYSFRYLLIYFSLGAAGGLAFILLQRHALVLRERERAAEAASRAKSAFLAMMSHEIRTPMNAVLGLASSLSDEPLSSEQHRVVREIQTSGDTLLRIINEILDFSRLDTSRLTFEAVAFSPAALTRATLSTQNMTALAKGLTLTGDIAADLPPVSRGDAGRVRQVLLNLVSNAIKFTAAGGVTVILRRLAADETRVTLEWTVSDTGIGIAPAQRGTVFDAFTQADSSIARRYGGSGLGLAICRAIVEQMGGGISVASEPGQGSVFRFHVPLEITTEILPVPAEEELGDKSDILRARINARGRKLRVLMAEDNLTNQLVIIRLLRPFAITLDIAGDGREAVRLAGGTPYDVVCMDMLMPAMDGLEATRVIRRTPGPNQAVPIIALTANVFPEDVAACHDAGMDHFIAKPVSRELLLSGLIDMLSLERSISSREARVREPSRHPV